MNSIKYLGGFVILIAAGVLIDTGLAIGKESKATLEAAKATDKCAQQGASSLTVTAYIDGKTTPTKAVLCFKK